MSDNGSNLLKYYTAITKNDLTEWDKLYQNYKSFDYYNAHSSTLIYIRGFSFQSTLNDLKTSILPSTLSIECRKDNEATPYNTEISLFYKTEKYNIFIEKKNTTDGDIAFNNLNPELSYYVVSHDTTNTYQDKAQDIQMQLDISSNATINVFNFKNKDGYITFHFMIYSYDDNPIVNVNVPFGVVENLEKINSENKKNIYFCKIRSMTDTYNINFTSQEDRYYNSVLNPKITNYSYNSSDFLSNVYSTSVKTSYESTDVKYEIKNKGIVRHINYYHSNTSFDSNNLPAPEINNSCIINKNYGYDNVDHYIRFGIARNDDSEFLTDQILIAKDQYYSKNVYYAPFDVTNQFNDINRGLAPIEIVGSCYIDPGKGAVGNGFLVCPPNSYIKVAIDAKFLKSFFVIEMYFKDLTPGYFDNKGLFSIETDVGQTYANLHASINTSNYLELNHGFIPGDGYVTSNTGSNISDGNWHHLLILRNPTATGTGSYIFVDGVLRVQSISINSITTDAPQYGIYSFFGKAHNMLTSNSHFAFQHIRITKDTDANRYASQILATNSIIPPTRFV